MHARARIGGVQQEVAASEISVLDMVLGADRERASLLAEAETATDAHRIGEIHTRLADIDAHSAEARASTILKGLGFPQDRQLAPTRELSGGWRMRVALAGVLFSQPDLLLLDEPTNYLDLEGALWLEKYLATYPYTVLMISHDRDLLNKAVTSIIHLDRGKLTFYRGNYDTFEETRRMQMELSNKSREKTLAQIAHLQSFVDRFKAKASKAKQAQARVKMIAKLKPPEALFDEHSSPFNFQQPKKAQAMPMITFDNVSVGYGDHVVLRHITNRIDPEDRIALVGPNGNGKSTFAKLLAGDLKPMGGQMRARQGARDRLFRPAPDGQAQARGHPGRARHPADALRQRGQAPEPGGPDGAVDLAHGHQGEKPERRRAGPPADGPHHLRRPGNADPRRADQPPRHRQPRRAGRRAQRLRGRGADHFARSPPDRCDLRHASGSRPTAR